MRVKMVPQNPDIIYPHMGGIDLHGLVVDRGQTEVEGGGDAGQTRVTPWNNLRP